MTLIQSYKVRFKRDINPCQDRFLVAGQEKGARESKWTNATVNNLRE